MAPMIQLPLPLSLSLSLSLPLCLHITLSHWELLAALPAISGRKWVASRPEQSEGESGLLVALDDVSGKEVFL